MRPPRALTIAGMLDSFGALAEDAAAESREGASGADAGQKLQAARRASDSARQQQAVTAPGEMNEQEREPLENVLRRLQLIDACAEPLRRAGYALVADVRAMTLGDLISDVGLERPHARRIVAACHPAASERAAAFWQILSDCGLEAFAEAMAREGFDDIDALRHATDDDLRVLGMGRGHIIRLREA